MQSFILTSARIYDVYLVSQDRIDFLQARCHY